MRYLNKYLFFRAGALAIFCALFSNPGSTQEIIIGQTSFNRDQSTLILEYRRFSSLLGRTHSTVVQAYGDGTVIVAFPPSHKKAGNYSLKLLSSELDSLVANIVEGNQSVETSSQTNTEASTIFAVSDSTFTEIDLEILSYALVSGESITLDSVMTIREKDLMLSSEQSPELSRRTNLSALENKILNLTQDPRLVKQ